jgi:DNA-binding NarL/FixJ family response regulator
VTVPIPILVVEDSKNMQAVLDDLFENIGGYEVRARLRTESEATEWLMNNRGRWKLAVIDLILDDGSGFNLIERCVADQDDGALVVLSDFASPAIKQRCLAMGADAVFGKGEGREFANYLDRFKDRFAATA